MFHLLSVKSESMEIWTPEGFNDKPEGCSKWHSFVKYKKILLFKFFKGAGLNENVAYQKSFYKGIYLVYLFIKYLSMLKNVQIIYIIHLVDRKSIFPGKVL